MNILVGLSSSLLVLYAVVAAIFVLLGRSPSIGFTVSSSLFFALACTCGAAMFLAVGAFTSQLMATRTRASAAAAAVFGASFLIRATADTARLHWLLAVSPIGWIEKLQPLTGSQPLWLLPIFGFTALLTGLTVWLASRRDLGDSVIADTDSARPHTALLNSPFWAGLRLTRASVAGWLLAIAFLGTFYGILTKAAVQAFNTAGNAAKVFNRIEHTAQHSLGTLYLGFVFFILMPIIMSLVASAVGHIRKDEAEGFVDNFLVRPVSRQRWLAGRLALVGLTAVLACLLSSLCIWAGQASQHAGVSFHDLLLAGLNMIAPVLFAFGFAMLAFGFVPRYTTLAIYGLIGWSFLISMVSSGLNLSHWLLDTSLLHQVALAPAVSPAWKTNAVMAALGLLLCAIGMWRFNSRDLQSE